MFTIKRHNFDGLKRGFYSFKGTALGRGTVWDVLVCIEVCKSRHYIAIKYLCTLRRDGRLMGRHRTYITLEVDPMLHEEDALSVHYVCSFQLKRELNFKRQPGN